MSVTWIQITDPEALLDRKTKYLRAIAQDKFVVCYRVHDESFINENLSYHKCNLELNAICDIAAEAKTDKKIYYFMPPPEQARFEGARGLGLTEQTRAMLIQKQIQPKLYDFADIERGAIWIIDEEFTALSEIHRLLSMARLYDAWKIIFFVKAQNLSLWNLLNDNKI